MTTYRERWDEMMSRREFAWEWVDTNCPWLFYVEDEPALLHRELHVKIAHDMIAALGLNDTRMFRYRLAGQIGVWLGEPAYFTPYVDRVAVDRAMGFDWPVIRRLSEREADALIERLAAMSDPFSEYEVHYSTPVNAREFPKVIWESQRRMAFNSGEPIERKTLNRAVGRRRIAQAAA